MTKENKREQIAADDFKTVTGRGEFERQKPDYKLLSALSEKDYAGLDQQKHFIVSAMIDAGGRPDIKAGHKTLENGTVLSPAQVGKAIEAIAAHDNVQDVLICEKVLRKGTDVADIKAAFEGTETPEKKKFKIYSAMTAATILEMRAQLRYPELNKDKNSRVPLQIAILNAIEKTGVFSVGEDTGGNLMMPTDRRDFVKDTMAQLCEDCDRAVETRILPALKKSGRHLTP